MKPFYCILLVIFSSCVALKPLKIQREDNVSNKLKLNGYYISCGYGKDSSLYEVIILYSNGVQIGYSERGKINCIIENNNYLSSNDVKLTTYPYNLGVYKINDDNTILSECWISTDYYYKTVQNYGKIVNDTTFYLQDNKIGKDTFKFVEFSPKPDSTNKFIK